MSPLELIDEYQKKNKLYVIELAICFGAALEYKKRSYAIDMCINSFPSEVLNEGQIRIYYQCFPGIVGKIIVEMVEYTELDKHKWADKKDDICEHKKRVSLVDYSIDNKQTEAVEYFETYYVKLDRSMITDVHNDRDKQDKINKLVDRFHKKGIKIVAEGIETGEELKFLRTYTNVDLLQGYYLVMPK